MVQTFTALENDYEILLWLTDAGYAVSSSGRSNGLWKTALAHELCCSVKGPAVEEEVEVLGVVTNHCFVLWELLMRRISQLTIELVVRYIFLSF